jgi:NAD-reducing hydrogenase small subunit
MSSQGKITMATAWLDGCSGCHMSFLDLDQRLIELASKVDIVYSPVVDAKKLPPSVDIGMLEGAISTEEDLAKAKMFRKHCKYLISLGDCAVTGNVPSLRNLFDLEEVFDRAYRDTVDCHPQRPTDGVPKLLHPVRPVHAVVKVDLCVQGCPPSADTIWYVLKELIEGRTPDPLAITRFGA